MNKSELKTGMWIICENGDSGMILLDTNNGDITSGINNWCPLNNYDENLEQTIHYDGYDDIIKVIQPTNNKDYYNINDKYADYKVLWGK